MEGDWLVALSTWVCAFAVAWIFFRGRRRDRVELKSPLSLTVENRTATTTAEGVETTEQQPEIKSDGRIEPVLTDTEDKGDREKEEPRAIQGASWEELQKEADSFVPEWQGRSPLRPKRVPSALAEAQSAFRNECAVLLTELNEATGELRSQGKNVMPEDLSGKEAILQRITSSLRNLLCERLSKEFNVSRAAECTVMSMCCTEVMRHDSLDALQWTADHYAGMHRQCRDVIGM